MSDEVILGNVMVDCDDEIKLQRFYGELLGWEMCELFDRPAVRSSNGIVFLFIEEPDYAPPVWPEETGKQRSKCADLLNSYLFVTIFVTFSVSNQCARQRI